MRSGLLLLTGVMTMVTVFLLVRYFRDDRGSDLDPVIDATEATATVPVWVGNDEGLEVVVRPVFPDPARVQFDRDVMNSHLSPGSPRVYYRLWIVNHGDSDRRLPESLGDALSGPGTAWSSESLTSLEGASDPALPAYLKTVVAFEAGRGERVIAPSEMISLMVAAPPSPDLEELAALTFGAAAGIALRPGRVRSEDLLTWEKRPRGRFGALVSYDGASSDSDVEQASRSR